MTGIPAAPAAVAHVSGGAQGPCGRVFFYCHPRGTWVEADIRGLPESGAGFFAFHIHEGRDCGGEDFAHTGAHFNPKGLPHPCHAGDLPPLLSAGGCARMGVLTDRFRVADILGRTVVIHRDPDDFRTQPAGNAGTKIACGVICPL